jgi:hypothetical protein
MPEVLYKVKFEVWPLGKDWAEVPTQAELPSKLRKAIDGLGEKKAPKYSEYIWTDDPSASTDIENVLARVPEKTTHEKKLKDDLRTRVRVSLVPVQQHPLPPSLVQRPEPAPRPDYGPIRGGHSPRPHPYNPRPSGASPAPKTSFSLVVLHEDRNLQIIKKPLLVEKWQIEKFLKECIDIEVLPPLSKLSPKTNKITWVSETFLIISKTTQHADTIFCSKMYKEFYIVTETHAEYNDTEPGTNHLISGEWEGWFKQELEITKHGLLHHRDAPGQKFCMYLVRGTSRSPLYNERFMYETLIQNNFIFTDKVENANHAGEMLTAGPVIVACGLEIKLRSDISSIKRITLDETRESVLASIFGAGFQRPPRRQAW